MAKLPGELDLGPLPTATVAAPDTGAVGRAGAALAAGAEQMGKGIVGLGEGLGELSTDINRWDYAKAHSYLLSGIIDQNEKTKADPNYQPDATGKPLTVRHEDAVKQLQTNSAAMIAAGPMRERFMSETQPLIARSVATAQDHARTLDNNAAVAWTQKSGDDAIDKGIATTDDETRRQLIDNHNVLVDGLVSKGAINQTQALEMKRDFAHRFTLADYYHRADTDPQGVINELRAAPGSGDEITNRIVKVEGRGKNPNSSAAYVGQFTDETWLATIKANRPDLAQGRSDADLLAMKADDKLGWQMTDALRRQNEGALKSAGVRADAGAQYLAHFLGAGAATAVLKADPNRPIADVLAEAVGPKKAQKMIDANPSILQGKLAGSVTQWADGKMGGYVPGAGAAADFLRPDVRETILARANATLEKHDVQAKADFKLRADDAVAEAFNTGAVAKPISKGEFISVYGADEGSRRYNAYDIAVQGGRTIAAMSTMSIEGRNAVVTSLQPKPGEANYALKLQAYNVAQEAAGKIDKAIKEDPAGYAVSKLPASSEAFKAFQDPNVVDPAARSSNAQKYAATTLAEQGKVGVPSDLQQIVPKGYADSVTNVLQKAAAADDPQARVGLIAQVQREAAMWGQYWPQVMRQLAPAVQPTVRAIAAGADPNAMTRLLSLDPKETVKTIVGAQNDTKINDLTKEINTAMAPFRQTLVGRQLDRDYPGYNALVSKLGALYVRDGDSAPDAAKKAFEAVIGNRYDFKDSWRMPKSAGVSADEVQAGTMVARGKFAELGVKPPLDDMPGRSDAAATDMALLARDGKWVTSPNNDGLNLAYGGKFALGADGKPLMLPWAELAKLGKDLAASEAATAQLYRSSIP